MTREVRANVILLAVLIPVLVPGFIFLMKKKLNGSSRPNFMPEAAPYQIAYIQPLPAPPVPRKEPERVRTWVRGLLEARSRLPMTAQPGVTHPDVSSIVSDRFVTQFVRFQSDDDGTLHVMLLHWQAANPAASRKPVVGLDTMTASTPSSTVELEAIDVPADVRHALQDVGYVDPPQRVWWIDAAFANTAAGGVKAVRLKTEPVAGREVEEILYLLNPPTRPEIEVTP